MYYVAVSNIGRVSVGERVLLMEDRLFEEISAVRADGEVVGYVASFDIEGCLSKSFLSGIIGQNLAIPCDVVLKSGDVMILGTSMDCNWANGNALARRLNFAN